MKGLLTEIQRFSLNDGPGIRTTVFFKGCNLRCQWCHNPETISAAPQIHYYQENCISCLNCVNICPAQAHSSKIDENGVESHVFIRELCKDCGLCADACFPKAMVLSGKEYTVEQVMSHILQDVDYYKNSGGVTLSGGEVLLQPEFAKVLLKSCKEKGIHTAIESNFHTSWSVIEELLPYIDLVMVDIKHSDEQVHKEVTGAGNRIILENIKKLSQTGTPFIVRTPVIPGVNDSEEVIANIVKFIHKLPNLMYYELLNYNPLGENKYVSLSMDYRFTHTKPLSEDRMETLARIQKDYQIIIKTKA